MKRRRNAARFTRRQYVVGATAAAIAMAAIYWKSRRASAGTKKFVLPATFQIPVPQPSGPDAAPQPDNTRSYGTTITIKVSKFGDTYDVVLHKLAEGDEFDIEVELRLSHYLQNNKYYGLAHHEFCRAVVLRGHVSATKYSGSVTNQTLEEAPLLCGDDDRLVPWPSSGSGYGDLTPQPKLDVDGEDLVISIEAAPLMYGNATPSPSGESTAWYQHHTQPHDYNLLVVLVVKETKT